MKYSYNLERKDIIFASAHDLNASYKDLCSVCDAVRYRPVSSALKILDGVIHENKAIEYRRHNKYMGSRHELHGKKGRFPKKCAKMVRDVIVNASANATGKGEDPEYMYVVHAAANKTQIIPRSPSKGVRAVRTGGYGYQSLRRSNIELAKIEIGIAQSDNTELGARMKRAIKAISKTEKPTAAQKQEKKPVARKSTPKSPLPVPVAQTPAAVPATTAANEQQLPQETKASA